MAGFNPFGSVPVPKKKRTNFNESFELSGTFPLSKVCPVCFIDSLPGSSWNINAFNLTRLETLIAPAMQRVDASILWFKMPKRLLFKHFKKWYSGGEDGEDDHQKPHIYLKRAVEEVKDVILDDAGVDYLEACEEFTKIIFGPGSLWNYIGLPVPLKYNSSTGQWEVLSIADWDYTKAGENDSDYIDIMPLMAYNFLYDCYFRDQTLNESIFVEGEEQDFTINSGWYSDVFSNTAGVTKYRFYFGPRDSHISIDNVIDICFWSDSQNLFDGGEIYTGNFLCLLNLFNRAWKKDYFTSALPTPQRGPEVKMGLAGTAPVTVGNIDEIALLNKTGRSMFFETPTFEADDSITAGDVFNANDTAGSYEPVTANIGENGAILDKLRGAYGSEVSGEPIFKQNGLTQNNLFGTADLTGVSPITITALRNLFKLQSFLEKNNVAGGRYIESILAHWGERVPDFTVQRPQFVRATKLPVQISEVIATANSSGTSSIVGDLAGRARTQGNLGKVHIYTQEPSFIFGLYCVTAPPAYAGQGIPRIFQHITRFDEPWPDFQHIGEQAIKLRELYYDFASDKIQDEDFGYQQRFSEYKFMPDRVVGDFQTSLAFWHMARMFNKPPRLNGDFVTQNLDPRIFAVQSGRPVTAGFYFEATAKLKLSKYSTPKLT